MQHFFNGRKSQRTKAKVRSWRLSTNCNDMFQNLTYFKEVNSDTVIYISAKFIMEHRINFVGYLNFF